jgi:hypothetical protein
MAPRKPSPEALIAELQKQRVALAVECATARSEMERAYDALGIAEPTGPNERGQATVRPLPEGQLTTKERRQIAGELRRLGRDHEPLEEIDAEERELSGVIKANGPAITELEGSMARLAADIETIEETHIEWFARKAHESSLAEVEKRTVARSAVMEAFEAREDAKHRWLKVDESRGRLEWEPLGKVPADDLESTISGFDATGRFAPWPKGKRLDGELLAAAWSPELAAIVRPAL